MDGYSRIIGFEEGWQILQEGICKHKEALNAGFESSPFDSEESTRLYKTAYSMCTQRPPYNYATGLYDKYKETLFDYVSTAVLPSMTGASGVFLITQFVKSSKNYKLMVGSLNHFFHPLDNCSYLDGGMSYAPIEEVARRCFLESVYDVSYGRIADAVMALVDRERQGWEIDYSLLKNLFDILDEIGIEATDPVQSCRSLLQFA